MGALVSKVIDNFVLNKIIKEEDSKIYEFGLKQGIAIMINLITIIVIGLISSELLNLLVFSVVYLVMRSYAGGYHAETELGCYVFSTMMIVIIAIISRILLLNNVMIVIMLVISDSILITLAPVENYRKKLSEKEIEVYRKRLRKILLIGNFIVIISMGLFNEAVEMVIVAITTIALMVLLGWIRNKRILNLN